FFSSRRRHTRFSRDWSSDVCSSDLSAPLATLPAQSAAWDERMLHAWNRTGVSWAGRPPSIDALFAGQAARTPDAIAVECDGASRSEERRVGKGRGTRGLAERAYTKD